MKIIMFLSYFLMIIQPLSLLSSQHSVQDSSLKAYIYDILKDNKTMLHEESIHNKILENLHKQLTLAELDERKIKIHSSIHKENERYEKIIHFIVKKIIHDPTHIPQGTPILHRSCSIVRPFSPDNSDEDNG